MGEKFKYEPGSEQKRIITAQQDKHDNDEPRGPREIVANYRQKTQTGFEDFLALEKKAKGAVFSYHEESLRQEFFNPIIEGFLSIEDALISGYKIEIVKEDSENQIYDLNEIADIRRLVSNFEKAMYKMGPNKYSPKRLFQNLYGKIATAVLGTRFSLKEGNQKWDIIKDWLREEIFRQMSQELIESAIQRKEGKQTPAQTIKNESRQSPTSIDNMLPRVENFQKGAVSETTNFEKAALPEQKIIIPAHEEIVKQHVAETTPAQPSASELLIQAIKEQQIEISSVPEQMSHHIIELTEGLHQNNPEQAKKSLENLINDIQREKLIALEEMRMASEQIGELNSHIASLEEKLVDQSARIDRITSIKDDYENEILEHLQTIESLQNEIKQLQGHLSTSEIKIQEVDKAKQEQQASQESKNQQIEQYTQLIEERIEALESQRFEIDDWLKNAAGLESVNDNVKFAMAKRKATSTQEVRLQLDASMQELFTMIDQIKQEYHVPESTMQAQKRTSGLVILINKLDQEKRSYELLKNDPLLWKKELPPYPSLDKIEQSDIELPLLPDHIELLREAAQRTGKQTLFPDLFPNEIAEQPPKLMTTEKPVEAESVPVLAQKPAEKERLPEDVTPIQEFIIEKEKAQTLISKLDLPFSIEVTSEIKEKARAVEIYFENLKGKKPQQIRDTLSMPGKMPRKKGSSEDIVEKMYEDFTYSVEQGTFIDELKNAVVTLGALRRADFTTKKFDVWLFALNASGLEKTMNDAGFKQADIKHIKSFLLGTTLSMSHIPHDEIKLITKSREGRFSLTIAGEEISKVWTNELVTSKKIAPDQLKKLYAAVNKK